MGRTDTTPQISLKWFPRCKRSLVFYAAPFFFVVLFTLISHYHMLHTFFWLYSFSVKNVSTLITQARQCHYSHIFFKLKKFTVNLIQPPLITSNHLTWNVHTISFLTLMEFVPVVNSHFDQTHFVGMYYHDCCECFQFRVIVDTG